MKAAILILALLPLFPSPGISQTQTLAEAAKAAGTDWIIGKWATEDGNVSISYTWKLDNYAVGVHFKLGDREAEGMIVRNPGTDDVVYGAADNKGGVTKGKWREYNDHPTLISTHTDTEGKVTKTAIEHIKTDAETMTVKIYTVGDDGEPGGSPLREVVFKRQK